MDAARTPPDFPSSICVGGSPNFSLRLARTSASSAGTGVLTARVDDLVPPLSEGGSLVLVVLEAGAVAST